jgi:hypothetical protein
MLYSYISSETVLDVLKDDVPQCEGRKRWVLGLRSSYAPSVCLPPTLSGVGSFDAFVSETGSRTCRLKTPQTPLLPRQCFVTLARLGCRLTSSSRLSKHRNCVGSSYALPEICLGIEDNLFFPFTAQFLPESRAHVFNAGASVWGLDWCPIHPDDRPRT